MREWLDTVTVAKLEGKKSADSINKRIQRGYYNQLQYKKESRTTGGYYYMLHVSALSENARKLLEEDITPALSIVSSEFNFESGRKTRSDAGTTSTDEQLIFLSACEISLKRKSSHDSLNNGRLYGVKKVYKNYYLPKCKEQNKKPVSYRQFLNLVKPFVDTQIQKRVTLGAVAYEVKHELKHHHDYSIYDPMQLLQNDHSQYDVVCKLRNTVVRPWAGEHISLGDRVRAYPSLDTRPTSYTLAESLTNFVLMFGLSRKGIIYDSDNGKQQKSRQMTWTDGHLEFEDTPITPFNLEQKHIEAIKLLGIGTYAEKGLIQNLAMTESHPVARHPHEKAIERAFGIGGNMEWFVERPEYTGRKYQEKPERLEKLIKSKMVWTAEEMIEFVIDRIDEYNHSSHQGIKKEAEGKWAVPHTLDLNLEYFQTNEKALRAFRGYVPDSMNDVYRLLNDADWSKRVLDTEVYSPLWRRRVFELCGWVSRALPAKETLAMLTMKTKDATVHTNGIVINKMWYIAIQLRDYVGKKLIVRYMENNVIRMREQSGKEVIFMKEIYVFQKHREFKNGKERFYEEFVCICEPHPATVKGLMPYGYAAQFNSERKKQRMLLAEAQHIMKKAVEDKIKVERSPIITQMPTANDLAAIRLEEAKQEKVEKAAEKKQDKELELVHISQLYGKEMEGN